MDEEVLTNCRAELGRSFERREASLAWCLAAQAAARLRQGGEALIEESRRALRHAEPHGLETLLRRAAQVVRAELPAAAQAVVPTTESAMFAAPAYLERVLHLTLERLLVNSAAPPLLIEPPARPCPLPQGPPPLYAAVFFDQPLAVTHELYPLCTDAYVHNLEAGTHDGIEPLGVYDSWMREDGTLVRAIHYDARDDVFVEADLPAPVRPSVSLVIAHSPSTHAELDRRLRSAGIPCGNPFHLAAVADDKWLCYQRWQAAGVPTPTTYLLPADATDEQVRRLVREALVASGSLPGGWIVQPRHGTEGRNVTFLTDPADIIGIWRRVRPADDAILRPRVGLLGLEEGSAPVPWDLRINVCHDGDAFRSTSGYLLVAGTAADPVAAVSQGGHAVPYRQLSERRLRSLSVPPGCAIPWDSQLLELASRTAEAAAAAVGPLSIAGVDLKFDDQGGAPVCCVLDLNPRPAGLLHADLLNRPETGIGTELWRGLRRRTRTEAR